MRRFMIDIETLGTGVDAVVLSVGVCCFAGYTSGNVHVGLELKKQLRRRSITEDTFLWWLEQSEEARSALLDIRKRAVSVFALHTMLSAMIGPEDEVWARGAHFDIAILDHLFAQVELPSPWKYNLVRDSRTVLALVPEEIMPKRGSTKHDALADASYEAACVSEALNWLGAVQQKPPTDNSPDEATL